MDLTLYDYWRSSAAYRLRIALNLKGLSYTSRSVDIHPDVTEQTGEAYRAVNPQMRVPSLAVDGRVAGQSMAILEWLEETHPQPPLLPEDPWQRLRARQIADLIACDIHPLNNISVLGTLRRDFGADGAAVKAWYAGWVTRGFEAIEAMLAGLGGEGPFLFGTGPTLAEVCLVPQVYNARRFDVPLDAFPLITALDAVCRALDAFAAAAPEAHPDAPAGG